MLLQQFAIAFCPVDPLGRNHREDFNAPGVLLLGLLDPFIQTREWRVEKNPSRPPRATQPIFLKPVEAFWDLSGTYSAMLGLTQLSNYITLKGSFSAVSKQNITADCRLYYLQISRNVFTKITTKKSF